MIDRLADMKSMVLKMSSRIKGDEFTIGIIEHLEKCNTLICNEHETGENQYKGDDLVVLEKNLNELVGRLSKAQNDMHHFAELISLMQIKYTPDTKETTKNIENINKGINRFDKSLLLDYDTQNNKEME
tara:strand:+ start:67 stop:453 length:387 start_codon:yes stop_codon:yes gene_type:complete